MKQASLFDGSIPFRITKPIRLIELFGGIGSQAKALTNLGVKFEHYRYCDFDKYAVKSYNAIHNTNFETTDITKLTAKDLNIVETDKYDYIMTYSFPCTDLSKAGKGLGMAKGSGTRSGLLWEVERLLDECNDLPQVLLMENVPDVIGTANAKHFAEWVQKLESLGHKNYWESLNAKNYGIPQNRERVFMVSLLGDYDYQFPSGIKLEKRLKDLLEENVDEKYYLSDKMLNFCINNTEKQKSKGNGFKFAPVELEKAEVAKTITTRSGSRIDDNFIKVVGHLDIKGNDQIRRVYDDNGLSSTLSTMAGGNRQPKILTIGNYSKSNHNASRIVDKNGISPTVMENHGTVTAINTDYRIRKLTPTECYLLMGFTKEDAAKVKEIGMSNSQMYKQAGNSIVVNVLMAIFKNLL